ncbi:LPXTG-motif cell wall anchor domain protein [Peptoniphilus duerdenii ATCC BAA-1640]|uniref:LPXTG-motif cell wall anchor domain protein n=2 Tax=Peptoniphilus TaxID=162289 RepID=E0NIX2_9FIRM|nr:LPXTG-motif cell wall anchor domain protein [Peptoniphilus duerdenii ATCC BAA-1640]
MVIISGAVYAKSLTIDLTGNNRKVDEVANREIVIWKIKDEIVTSDDAKEKLVKDLNKKSVDELNKIDKKPYTVTTDANGVASLVGLKSGTYYARVADNGKVEIFPFVFYVDENSPNDVTIMPKGRHEVPPPDNHVELIKVSADDVPLAGAVFNLYKVVNGEETLVKSNLITDSNGKISIKGIELGEYLFEEVQAPEGYRIKNARTRFVVNGGTTKVVVVNYKDSDGGKRFRKIDSDSKEPIEGVRFIVTKRVNGYDERVKINGKDLVLVSDKDGYFSVDNLPFGTYFVWEVKPAGGYEPLGELQSFVIDENSLVNDLVIKNTPIPPPPEKDKPKPPPEGGQKPKKPPRDKDKPKKPRRIPKTGDISLILMSIFGVICSIWGGVLVKENK